MLATTPLVTLTGSGGVGKTRLALRAAGKVLAAFPDGVRLVELAALTDSALVPQVVASALEVRPEPDRSLSETLSGYLRPRRLLLVLDNCEHLVAACATLVDPLLRACPRLAVMATSRQALNVPGEVTWRVPSLSRPDPQCLPHWKALPQYEAVRLFVERARSSRRDFVLSEHNILAVAQICHRLDGIPLAIELAAARVRTLSPEQIAERLDRSFQLLTGGSRTALPRQQTLRATVEWSYQLLDVAERTLFDRLAVFAGGFTLEAAEEVCAGENLARDEVPELVSQLADKSLVEAEGGAEGPMRYRLLEALREYGLERLAERGELGQVRFRHMSYFLALAERAKPAQLGMDAEVWLDRLERDHDNLRAALRCCLAQGRIEAEVAGAGNEAKVQDSALVCGLRLVSALWRFWEARGYWTEGRERLTSLLALPAAPRTAPRAEALLGLGRLSHFQGDYATARALYEESLALSRELGDRQIVAQALSNLAMVAQVQGDYGAARARYEESLALSRELGDKPGTARGLNNLGIVVQFQGDYATARALNEESLATWRQLGHKRGIAYSLNAVAEVARCQGDYVAAGLLYKESLDLFTKLRNKQGMVMTLHNLAHVVLNEGDRRQAAALFRKSLSLSRELGKRRSIALCLAGLAGVAMAEGQPERAAHILATAEALLGALSARLDPVDRGEYERNMAAAQAGLDEETFSAAWAAGHAMTLEEAIAYATEVSRLGPRVSRTQAQDPDLELQISRTGAPQLGLLTQREREVAALVARGLTNREIGEELVITEGTANQHVKHILNKLGFSSRAQVAAWAERQGLVAEPSVASSDT